MRLKLFSILLLRFLISTMLISIVVGAKSCEPISIPLCKGIGYNMTSFPNSYGHEKQEEAGLEVHQFYPLVEVGCYSHLKFFLCTLYTPICQANYDQPILPCMELCLEAKKRCSPIMQRYGFRWPETLSCETLPRMSDQTASGNICAAPPDTPKQKTKAPPLPSLYEDSELEVVDVDAASQCECSCRAPFHRTTNGFSKVGNVSNCGYGCRSPVLTEGNRRFLGSWIAVWSCTCFVLSALTFFTFVIEMDRFQYPERPIFMLAFCQMMVAVAYLIRLFLGHDQVACEALRMKDEPEQSNGAVCLLVFLLSYYFSMASAMWWVVLALTWVLAAAKKWSTEAISSYSRSFHLLGWLVPLVQTLLVVAFNAIDGDPVSGMCSVGNTHVHFLRVFVLGPLCAYFTMGVVLLTVGFYNLWSIRNEVQKQHPLLNSAAKLTQLMSRIGIFSVLYTVPALFIILVLIFEQHARPLWEEMTLCPCSSQTIHKQEDYSLLLSLVKIACQCVVGWTTGVWVCSRKTLMSWTRLICCLGRPSPSVKYQPADLLYAKSDMSPPPHFYNTALRQHLYGTHPEKL